MALGPPRFGQISAEPHRLFKHRLHDTQQAKRQALSRMRRRDEHVGDRHFTPLSWALVDHGRHRGMDADDPSVRRVSFPEDRQLNGMIVLTPGHGSGKVRVYMSDRQPPLLSFKHRSADAWCLIVKLWASRCGHG